MHLRPETVRPDGGSDRSRAIVDDQQIIRQIVQRRHGSAESKDYYISGAERGLDDRWFAFHCVRAALARWCALMAEQGGGNMPAKVAIEASGDADSVALLRFADAAATGQCSGKTVNACRLIYGQAKRIISSSHLSSLLPGEEKMRVAAYFIWEHRGKAPGHDLDDWLMAEEETLDTLWDEL
jgi:hypothetical protein